jgi:hypothetical protein
MDDDSGSAGNNHHIAGALHRHHLTAFQDGLASWLSARQATLAVGSLLLTQWGAVIVPDLKTIAPLQFYNASNPATYSRG